jgi:hypothetical protein
MGSSGGAPVQGAARLTHVGQGSACDAYSCASHPCNHQNHSRVIAGLRAGDYVSEA